MSFPVVPRTKNHLEVKDLPVDFLFLRTSGGLMALACIIHESLGIRE